MSKEVWGGVSISPLLLDNIALYFPVQLICIKNPCSFSVLRRDFFIVLQPRN
jgi:hypothetical protein